MHAIIASDNGLLPVRRQAIIWTNAGLLLIKTLGDKFLWNLNQNTRISIDKNAFENVICKMSAIFCWSQCVNSLVLTIDLCYMYMYL